jgi:hypothetical protein
MAGFPDKTCFGKLASESGVIVANRNPQVLIVA